MTVDAFSSIAIALLALGLVLQAEGSLLGGRRQRAQLAVRVDALHDKVDAIAEHLGVILPAVDHADVDALLAEGRKVDAIRTYRRRSSAGLVEAAQFVEELDRRPPGRDGKEAVGPDLGPVGERPDRPAQP